MEPDRFIQHQKLYIVGLVCMLLSLILFFFSLYMLPFFIWGLHYHVPYIIDVMTAHFVEVNHYSVATSKLFTWLIFFIPAVIAGLISYAISNHIDNQILGVNPNTSLEQENEEERAARRSAEAKDTIALTMKILFLMIIIVIVVLILPYII